MPIGVKDLCARELNRKISLQTENTSQSDGGGGQDISWPEYAAAWAKVVPYRGRENPFAAQLRSTVTHTFYIYYDVNVVPKMRIAYNGKLYSIKAVIDIEDARRFMELQTEEGETP
jgi:SPP1 family predicted phage head-tail adaptor